MTVFVWTEQTTIFRSINFLAWQFGILSPVYLQQTVVINSDVTNNGNKYLLLYSTSCCPKYRVNRVLFDFPIIVESFLVQPNMITLVEYCTRNIADVKAPVLIVSIPCYRKSNHVTIIIFKLFVFIQRNICIVNRDSTCLLLYEIIMFQKLKLFPSGSKENYYSHLMVFITGNQM